MNDPVGDFYIDKIIGKCPRCDYSMRAHGGVSTGIDIQCTNFKCQASWEES